MDRTEGSGAVVAARALDAEAAQAVERLEQATREFAGDAIILRFGRFWGPGTAHRTVPRPPTIHIERAGAHAAQHLVHAASGIYLVIDTDSPD